MDIGSVGLVPINEGCLRRFRGVMVSRCHVPVVWVEDLMHTRLSCKNIARRSDTTELGQLVQNTLYTEVSQLQRARANSTP